MNYRNIAITQKGLALHSKCTLRQGGIEFTRFATGDFRHEEGLDLTLLTGLTNEKQSFPFSNITRYSENEILLSVVITNVGLKESYYINEIGIFANDTDEGEILYAVTVPDNPDVDIDYMSAYDEESPNPHTIYFDQYLKASNTAECTITVDEKSHASLKEFLEHINNKENPHCTRREQLAIENVDNTSDMDKPVSRAQQDALDAQYRQLTSYTDTEIADLIDGAPQTLDTLREIAEAMTDNKDVVEALQEAVGSKASKAEFDSHESNYHNPHRVEAEDVGLGNVPNVSTNDQTPTYTPVTLPTVLTSGEKLSAAFGKLAGAVADYITHKADMIKRMTAVEAGVSSLNKNLSTINGVISDAIEGKWDYVLTKQHTEIVFYIQVILTSSSKTGVLCRIPTDFRPIKHLKFICPQSCSSILYPLYLEISTDGYVRFDVGSLSTDSLLYMQTELRWKNSYK